MFIKSANDENSRRNASKVSDVVLSIRLTVHRTLLHWNETTWAKEVALWEWPTIRASPGAVLDFWRARDDERRALGRFHVQVNPVQELEHRV